MPHIMESVVVFGDSLSDIGRKWTTKSGRAAITFNEMYVSPSGRFSDCRNWTDFMIEDAGARSLVNGSAENTVARSQRHLNFSKQSGIYSDADQFHPFHYANYADGGACGMTPVTKERFLRTFKEQVDWFEADLAKTDVLLGNTLFIIWFGANDLYTAGRKATEMHLVAQEVAETQRSRLAQIVKRQHCAPWFVFVNLGHPLSSVFYSRNLAAAEAAVRNDIAVAAVNGPNGRLDSAKKTISIAAQTIAPSWFGAGGRLKALQEEVALVENLEAGVMNYNTALLATATLQDDAVVKIAHAISESVLKSLVASGLMAAGAMGNRATQVSAANYNPGGAAQPLTTIDQKHPTDQMYKFLWEEIYAELTRAGISFGQLRGAAVGQTLNLVKQRVSLMAELVARH